MMIMNQTFWPLAFVSDVRIWTDIHQDKLGVPRTGFCEYFTVQGDNTTGEGVQTYSFTELMRFSIIWF